MSKYDIDKYEVLHLSLLQRDGYTFNTKDKCPDIVVGDSITIDKGTYVIESLEWFNLMMNGSDGKPMRGTNVTVLLEGV